MIDLNKFPSLPGVNGKKVFLRIDLNVELKNGKVPEYGLFRLNSAIPFLNSLAGRGAQVLLLSHLGAPDGYDKNYSLKPYLGLLKKLSSTECDFLDMEKFILKGSRKRVVLIENLRFYPEEAKCDPSWSKRIASFADIYINDAFSASHRNNSSLVLFPKFIPGYLGQVFRKEVKKFNWVLGSGGYGEKILLLGGRKISTKIGYMPKLLKKFSIILVAGAMANTFLKANGFDIKDSFYEPDFVRKAKSLLSNFKNRIFSPIDFVWDKSGRVIMDIGEGAVQHYASFIRGAKIFVWNGPLGFFEKGDEYLKSTRNLAALLSTSESIYKIAGGGETVMSLDKVRALKKISFISTAGGAMLHYFAEETLPALKYLKQI